MKGTRRFRLTKASKILILILVVALVVGGVFAGVKTGAIKTGTNKKEESISSNKKEESTVTADDDGNVINTNKGDDKTINLSLDEWIG